MDNTLKDIKPLLIWSDYLPFALSVLGVILLLLLLGLLWRRFSQTQAARQRKADIRALETVDFDDPKEAAYAITEIGRRLAQTPRQNDLLEELIAKLEPYKYKPHVPAVSQAVQNYLKVFLDAVVE